MRRFSDWQGRQESNPQPTVLETAALPIELLPFMKYVTGRVSLQ